MNDPYTAGSAALPGRRALAAETGGVTRQGDSSGDWVLRFNAYRAAGLVDRKAPGQPPRLICRSFYLI